MGNIMHRFKNKNKKLYFSWKRYETLWSIFVKRLTCLFMIFFLLADLIKLLFSFSFDENGFLFESGNRRIRSNDVLSASMVLSVEMSFQCLNKNQKQNPSKTFFSFGINSVECQSRSTIRPLYRDWNYDNH